MQANEGGALGGKETIVWCLVAALFVASGTAALIYEVTWFHLLRLVIGGSWLSLGILIASFMGGMCLGSLLLPRLVSTQWHPLRVYAALELAIGVMGGTLPAWLPQLSEWYLGVADESLTGASARAAVAAVALLPPTMCMGATLPAVARWVRGTPEGLARLGVFYGANTFGAVLGCLLAAFVLLPASDAVQTSYFAAAMNAAAAGGAWLLSLAVRYDAVEEASEARSPAADNAPVVVLVVIALSGLTALGAEVIWTRLLAMLFGATVYTFAIILAVFLAGLGIGSTVAARLVPRVKSPLRSLAFTQLAIACLVPYANFVISRVVPFWERPMVVETAEVYRIFAHDTLRASLALLPAAVAWGASFPLALAAAGHGRKAGHEFGDAGRLVGQVYAANTLGAIFGSLATSAFLVPWIGLQHAQQILALAAGLASLLAFCAAAKEHGKTAAGPLKFAPLAIAVAAALLVVVPPVGMFGRSMRPHLWNEPYTELFHQDGRSATVSVQQHQQMDFRAMCIGGKIEASNLKLDLRCQRMLGHLPALLHPAPKKILVVGMGTGSTAGCFTLHGEVESITICEIEPVVCEAAGRFFAAENHRVLEDARTTVHFDDARHFLATTDEKFDIITSDPINSWIHGAAALYSREHFELCKRHLNPGGIVVQWIPLYEKDIDTAKCELATFLEAFPNATLWTSWRTGDYVETLHDIIAVGQLEPRPLDLADIDRRTSATEKLTAALEAVDLATIPSLMAQYAGRGDNLQPWLAGAEINRDLSLRLEYLAGLSLWVKQSEAIFDEIAAYRRYPAGILRNDEPYEADIRQRLKLPAASK